MNTFQPRPALRHGAIAVALFVLLVSASSAAAQEPASEDEAQSGIIEKADEILRKVEEVRGLRSTGQVTKGVMQRKDLEARLLEDLAEQNLQHELEIEGALLKHLGLIPVDMNYEGFLVALLTDQIAGFYDDKSKELYILDGGGADQDIVVAHELFHAVQDQVYSIDTIRFTDDAISDRALARAALIEGDATATMLDYKLHPQSFTEIFGLGTLMRASMSFADSGLLSTSPAVLSKSLVAPYIDGLEFVKAVKLAGGWDGVNETYLAPPNSTEQLLHPERFLDRDVPQRIVHAYDFEGFSPVYEDVMGELWTRFVFEEHMPPSVASAAAKGWDGDLLLYFDPDWASEDANESAEKDQRTGGKEARFALGLSVWDSREDALEAAAAFAHGFQSRFPDVRVKTDQTRTWYGTRAGKSYGVFVRGDAVLWVDGFTGPIDASLLEKLWRFQRTDYPNDAGTKYTLPVTTKPPETRGL